MPHPPPPHTRLVSLGSNVTLLGERTESPTGLQKEGSRAIGIKPLLLLPSVAGSLDVKKFCPDEHLMWIQTPPASGLRLG